MISNLINDVKLELEYQSLLLRRMEKRLKILDVYKDKRLVANRGKSGSVRYYVLECRDGQEKRIYLGKKQEAFRKAIQERYYLSRAIDNCRKNIEMLEMLKDSYYFLEPVNIVGNAPLAYREQENAYKLLYGFEKSERWKERKLKQKAKYKPYKADKLTHIAGDGTKTRSKSEAMIIDLLNAKEIPYVYDYPMIINEKLKIPDFVILDTRSNREILIEHLGLMADEGYRERQYEKIGNYIDDGYTPNENILITFDDKDGNINIPAISRAIDAIMCR